jgi:hypothetical protein
MRVRKLGAGSLTWRGGQLAGGESGDVPLEVVERYAAKLEVLEELPPPRPVVADTPVTPVKKAVKKAVKKPSARKAKPKA